MKKKLSAGLLCLLMVLTVIGLSGCGGKDEDKAEGSEYPVMEKAEEPESAEEASYGDFTAKYDKDKFVFNTSMGQFAIYDKEGYESGSDSIENINVRVSEAFEGPLTEEDMNTLMTQLKQLDASSGFKVTNNEMRMFDGEPIIYYEAETKLTDEMLDLLIEDGSITEADIQAMGGREALISLPAVKQIGFNAVIDGKTVTLTGTYNDSPDEILEAMKLLVQTGKTA